MNIMINKDRTFLNQLHRATENHQNLTNFKLFQMHYRLKQQMLLKDFHSLLVPNYLPHMEFLEHQIDTAKRVMEDMNGRAILADEVGLGKTIEAGLILKEYMVRGLVKRVLLLVPASLVNQWIQELYEKFHIRAIAYRKNYRWDAHPIIVSSIDLAKREPHQSEILNIDYDMVIFDEAHKLKNEQTKNYAFARAIKKKYCLLLTATPIQNRLTEIFNLVTILKPGYLGTFTDFKEMYQQDKLGDSYLHKLIQKVMVRNVRKDTILKDIGRNVKTVWLEFTRGEYTVYQKLEKLFSGAAALSKITYLKEFCSSREACYLSLQAAKDTVPHEGKEEVLAAIERLPQHVKALKLVELIQSLGNEKVIVFTEYRATQYYLEWILLQNGITSVSFRGGLNAGRKAWLTELFRQERQVFIATEAGGEGINLQFCRYIVNYDLPWNPMRLEQRIGRIHRFGQKHDTEIYHFAIKQTIEEHIMHLLYNKIELFEQIIGKLDRILAAHHINFEKEWMDIMETSSSIGEMQIKMDHLVAVIEGLEETSDAK